jgi:anti-sigma-K factor RskA
MAVIDEHDRLVEDLAAYALEALEGPERARVEAHVATCPTCSDLLQEYRAVVGLLPRSLDLVAPPAAAWSAIRADARERTVREGRRRWALSAPRWLRLAAQPAMALALVGMVFWNVMLQRELARRAPGPAPGPEVEALSRRPGQVVILTGSGARGASARLFVASDGGHGHLAISGLQPLSRNRTYQLWFVRHDGAATSGATFDVDRTGRAWVSIDVHGSLAGVDAITVTEEPAPRSDRPTGLPLLEAKTSP